MASRPDQARLAQKRPFNLIRWFSLVGLASIAIFSAAAALLLVAFLTDRMIQQDAELTMAFVRGEVSARDGHVHFSAAARAPEMHAFFSDIARQPNVLRANVYSAEQRLIWSSDPQLLGRPLGENPELKEALDDRLVVHSGVIGPDARRKWEHIDFRADERFVESYIPIWNEAGSRVIGVVELYKVPRPLFDTIRAGERLIWAAALLGGLFLYATLYWVVRKAHRIMVRQQAQLIEGEAMAMMGEMSAAVAHGLRNPLASIRSSAELALDSESQYARDCLSDIVAQVDRLESWLRELLAYARPSGRPSEAVDVNAVVRESLGQFATEFERRRIARELDLAQGLPPACGDAAMLRQLVSSLISNALEAMSGAGQIVLATWHEPAAKRIVIQVRDSGPGIAAAQRDKVFQPFYTTKANGVGLGLPLVRRVVERLGGSVSLESALGAGTSVSLRMPSAS